MADVYRLAEQFGEAAIAIDDIYRFSVDPGAVMQNYQTPQNGFLFTTKGNASVVFNGALYELSPGMIVHGTQHMTIDAEVTGSASWEYYLILYRLGEEKGDKHTAIRTHFALHTGMNLRIYELLRMMSDMANSSDKIRNFRGKAMFFDVLYEALSSSQYCVYRKSQQAAIAEAERFIRAHCEEQLTAAELAGLHGMTAGNFSYLFHKYVGIRPMDFLMQCRMDRAHQLLEATDLPIHAIAAQVGYADPLYFSRIFKKHTGVSPSKLPARMSSPLQIRP